MVSSVKHPSGADISHGELGVYGEPADRLGVNKMVVYGHSLAYGIGATDADRDVTTHLASMLKAREMPRATSAAILHWHQASVPGDGGWAHILQNEIRKTRASTTLSALSNAGASTIAVTAGAAIANKDLLFVGTGASGSGGGEMLFVTAGGGTNTLTVSRPTGETTTARTHQSGEPVYVVPSGYVNLNPLYLLWYGINDLAASAIGSADPVIADRFMAPMRLAISRIRCAEIYEQDHVSCIYTGSWGAHSALTSANSGATYRAPSAVNAAVTIHVPENFQGGTIVLGFGAAASQTTEPVWSFTVDGNAAGTLNIRPNYSAVAKNNGYVKRLTGLSAGRHTVVATITTLGAGGGSYFDWWGIEAPRPPVVLVAGLNRPYSYSLTWPNWTNARRETTLNMGGGAAIGTTAFTMTAAPVAPIPGATVTFEEGAGNAETLEIAGTPTPTTTTFTTTSASTKTHAQSSALVFGMQDADVARVNTKIQALITEFDNRVVFVDTDTAINKNANYFASDGVHFTDEGAASLTDEFFGALMRAEGFTPSITSYTAVPTTPLPSEVVFCTNSGSALSAVNQAWVNMPSAVTELFGATAYRRTVDLTKCFEGRLHVGVLTNVGSGATTALRLQYSLDNGTTWKYIDRLATFAEGTGFEVAALNSAGSKVSAWAPIAAEALIKDVLLRVVGINGNATADPSFTYVIASFR